MRTQRQVWFAWGAVLVWMGVIFMASTDALSAAHTSRIIEPVLRWIFGNRLTPAAFEEIHFYIRKLGHVTEYAILAVLVANALQRSLPALREPSVGWLAALFAACHAAGDEFHQSFVPSRTASVRDVLIDIIGALLGLALLHRIRHLRFKPRPAAYPRHPAKS